MIKTKFETPFRTINLRRYPVLANEKLQAFNSADELLLNYIVEENLDLEDKRILIINDSCGALSTSLSKFDLTSVFDSYVSKRATEENLKENKIEESKITFLNSTESFTGNFDIILIKLPGNFSYLEDMLYRLRAHMNKESIILCAGMTKFIRSNIIKSFEKIIGETKTSLARKKARIIISNKTIDAINRDNPYPQNLRMLDFDVSNHSNVFSRENLDIGTRFFLDNMPSLDESRDLCDLGCGNGMLSLGALKKNAQLNITLVDESWMACDSSKKNITTNFPDSNKKVLWKNCLEDCEESSFDTILCNPPFHQGTTITDHIAWQMFNDAKKTLKKDGILYVIGNRHLNYHIKLKKIFRNCESIISNKKFVILKVKKL